MWRHFMHSKLIFEVLQAMAPRMIRSVHCQSPLFAPVMEPKRQQEAAIARKVSQAKQELQAQIQKRRDLWSQYTPVEDATYTRRVPNPLVPQPTNAKVLECTVAGLPSAGKSSLLCALVKHKVSATSRKINTTMRPVVGVLTKGETQIIFTDTPGIDVLLESDPPVLKEMASGAFMALQNTLVTIYVHDVRRGLDPASRRLLQQLVEVKQSSPERQLFVVFTHVDLVRESAKVELTRMQLKHAFPNQVDNVFPVNALVGSGLGPLIKTLLSRAVAGPWQYPAGCPTNQSDVQLVDDIVREKIFRRLNCELPYQISNATIGWTVANNGFLRIDHAIYVSRPTHTRLVQSALRFIHERALRDIQGVLNRNCYLNFQVIDRSAPARTSSHGGVDNVPSASISLGNAQSRTFE